jgi:uncharacterized protein (TIGR04255 family)
MNSTPSSRLPRFDHPPVIETFLGVQFNPIAGWDIPFFGLFWETIRDRYPRFKVVPPIGTPHEDQEQPMRSNMSIAVSMAPLPARLWFFNASETQLIQVQANRFIFNWKRGLVDASYPHYESLRPSFETEWLHFQDFVERSGLGRIDIKKCEISYINHVELGASWGGFGELESLLTVWAAKPAASALPPPEVINLGIRYQLPSGRGRMEVSAEPAIRNEDNKDVMQLTILARGNPESSDLTDVLDWFDFSHSQVKRAFIELTTTQMHSVWGFRNQL